MVRHFLYQNDFRFFSGRIVQKKEIFVFSSKQFMNALSDLQLHSLEQFSDFSGLQSIHTGLRTHKGTATLLRSCHWSDR